VRSSGLGTVVSWRLVHRGDGKGSREVAPSMIAVVQLEEGPRVYATIDGEAPPVSDDAIRVRFRPRSRAGGFPVFTVCPLPDSIRAGRGLSARRPVERVQSRPGPDIEPRYDVTWVRTALHHCDLLERSHCLDATATSVIGFAIRWAPFGGATTGEVFVTFGMTRRRFLRLVDEALHTRRTDTATVRRLKHQLQKSLSQAWTKSTALPAGGVG
jgi:hypothetical protein